MRRRKISTWAELELGGERLRFRKSSDPVHEWWVGEVQRGAWEPAVLERYSGVLNDGDVVLDIGAYVGPYTLLASRLVGPDGRVFAFEPDPVARELLEANVEGNSAANVTVIAAAVSDTPGTVRLRSERLGNSMTTAWPDDGELAIAAVTLASFCRERDIAPAVIKIDVEGSEAEVLAEDAADLVRGARATFVEIHERHLRERGVEPSRFLDRLADWGLEFQELDRRSSENYDLEMSIRTPRGADG